MLSRPTVETMAEIARGRTRVTRPRITADFPHISADSPRRAGTGIAHQMCACSGRPIVTRHNRFLIGFFLLLLAALGTAVFWPTDINADQGSRAAPRSSSGQGSRGAPPPSGGQGA